MMSVSAKAHPRTPPLVAAPRDTWPAEYPRLAQVPVHVGITMDGNGRWARARHLPRVAGHRAGTNNVRRILQASVQFGIKIVTLYAFSTENWHRPPAEVRALFRILADAIKRETPELHANGVQIRHLGSFEGTPAYLVERIRDALALTRHNQRLILNVAFNYGGRAEIVRAVRKVMAAGLPPEAVTEETISQYLDTAGLPDPDLIIRTGGEMRSSNFLTWQSTYSEYYSTTTYWPDFDADEYYRALAAYSRRVRRFGRVLPGAEEDGIRAGQATTPDRNGAADASTK